MYFAAFDVTIESIRTRFSQEEFGSFRNLQELMLKAVSGKPLDEELEEIKNLFGDEINEF